VNELCHFKAAEDIPPITLAPPCQAIANLPVFNDGIVLFNMSAIDQGCRDKQMKPLLSHIKAPYTMPSYKI
jgi:hypothetical protein